MTTDQPRPERTAASQPVPDALISHVQRTLYNHPAVIAGIMERDRVGRQRYGQSLHTFDGRDTGQDAWEEVLDLAQYAMKWSIEAAVSNDGTWAEKGGIADEALSLACRIARIREDERVRSGEGA